MKRTRIAPALLALAALYVVAGGYSHLNQWLDGYRNIPAAVPGWWVVRIGFPVSAGTSLIVAAALITAAARASLRLPALVIAAGFELSSLGVLLATRMGSVFGWSEHGWTAGARQTFALELGAMATIALVGVA